MFHRIAVWRVFVTRLFQRNRRTAAVRVRGVGGRMCAERSHGRQDSDRRSARVRLLNPPTLETTMQAAADRAEAPTAIQTDLRAIFVSLELSRSTWLITFLSLCGGEKMSKHSVPAGDIAGLLRRFAQLKEKARARTGRDFPISSFRSPASTAFGSTGCCSPKGSRATWLTPRRS